MLPGSSRPASSRAQCCIHHPGLLPWPRSAALGWQRAVEQKGTGFVPRPAQGRCAGLPTPPAQPLLLARRSLVLGEAVRCVAKPSLGACGAAVPCGACCSAGDGCWPPDAWWVPAAAAATGAARAGTTRAGCPVPAGLTATATRTARGRATAARTTTACAAAPLWAARWGPGGRGAGAVPRAGWAARPAAARSPSRRGTEGSPVLTSSSAAAAWASTRPAAQPKRWPRYYPIPSARTSGTPGEELGCCCWRSHPGRAPVPRAGLEPPAAPGQASVCRVPGGHVPTPCPLHRARAAGSQDFLGGCLRGRVSGLMGAGGAAGGLCLLPTSSHLCVAPPGLLLALGADSLRSP